MNIYNMIIFFENQNLKICQHKAIIINQAMILPHNDYMIYAVHDDSFFLQLDAVTFIAHKSKIHAVLSV